MLIRADVTPLQKVLNLRMRIQLLVQIRIHILIWIKSGLEVIVWGYGYYAFVGLVCSLHASPYIIIGKGRQRSSIISAKCMKLQK